MDGVTLKRSQERQEGGEGVHHEIKGTSASPGDANATDTQMSGSQTVGGRVNVHLLCRLRFIIQD